MKKMRAVFVHAPGDLRYEEIGIPSINQKTLLVKILAAGICGGDRKTFQGEKFWLERDFPYIPGHEFIGEVTEIGREAAKQYGLKVGDYTTAEIIIPCFKCYYCIRGSYHFCLNGKYYGSQKNGAWAEYMKYEENSIVWKVPKFNPTRMGALIEPLSCAIHAIEQSEIRFEDTVAISGMGAIGLLMLQVAKFKTPKCIVALDIQDSMLTIAQQLGADVTININKENVSEHIMDITDGLGCDVFIEVSGSGSALSLGVSLLKKRGRMVIFATYSKETPINFTYIGDAKELDIRGCHISPHTYPTAIRYLAEGLINVEKVVTHILPLSSFRKGLTLQSTETVPRGKVILMPRLSEKA